MRHKICTNLKISIVSVACLLFLGVNNYAQTSGPTAPEYTSFEPVDATDLVNPATGTFTYNMPLLEVPGPEGGYPIVLSYHAGIQPLEEASWVGLGWTLNAGAITRMVNGFPDDQMNALRLVRDYDSGGKTISVSVGIGLPGISFGLQFSHDSNQGFGVGASISGGIGLGKDGGGVGIGVTVGISPHSGKPYAGVGVSMPVGKSENLSGNLSYSTDFESAGSFGVSASYSPKGKGTKDKVSASHSILDISMSASNGGSASFSVAGTSVANNNAGNYTVNSVGFSIPIPLGPVLLNIGFNYTRYYLDAEDYLQVYGVLHAKQIKHSEKSAFDHYSLLDPENDFIEDNNPSKEKGGSFPAYDSYYVNAQGVSGSIQPHIFQNISLFGQNIKDNITYNPRYFFTKKKVHFRFVNDFSNSMMLSSDWKHRETLNGGIISKKFLNTKVIAAEESSYQNNHLAGSKHVEWYTNAEIRNGSAYKDGLISPNYFGNHPVDYAGLAIDKQLGGYKITNESGVTYHFSLPVYQYGDYQKSEKIKLKKGKTIFHEQDDLQPYAYQWLLTAITGPDYIDRGELGKLDNDDWGYWVGFEYEKYVKNHQWRNPIIGENIDIDNETKIFSGGMKEVYYLDAISTRTHRAVFHKSLRYDGREVSDIYNGGVENSVLSYDNYERVRKKCVDLNLLVGFFNNLKLCTKKRLLKATTYLPRPLKKLDKITLHRTKDLQKGVQPSKSNTLKAIQFGYNYSLQPGLINSYDESDIRAKKGKLTLNKITYLGKQEKGSMPPTVFSYDLPKQEHLIKILSTETLDDDENAFQIGDIITFKQRTKQYYLLLTGKGSYRLLGGKMENGKYIEISASKDASNLINKSFKAWKTKNPPYDKNAFDLWRYYKSDFKASDLGVSETTARLTTPISSKNVDAWSLRSIKTTLGSKIDINYESNRFIPVLNKYLALNADRIGWSKQRGEIKLDFPEFTNQYFIKGEKYKVVLINSHVQFVGSKVKDIKLHEIEVEYKSSYRRYNSFFSIFKADLSNIITQEESSWGNDNIVAASVILNMNNGFYGGGMRTKIVSINNSTSSRTSTLYNYGGNKSDNGIVSYYPNYNHNIHLDDDLTGKLKQAFLEKLNDEDYKDIPKKYNKLANTGISKLLAVARDVPSPAVVYPRVTISEAINGKNIEGKVVKEYETFNDKMVIREKPSIKLSKEGYTSIKDHYPMTIHQYSTRMGNLKSIRTYGKDKNIPISKSEYKYLHDYYPDQESFKNALKNQYKNQGVIAEAFHEYKYVKNAITDSESKRITYPNILVNEIITDYKTGITTEGWNLEYDFYNGNVTKKLIKDSYGNYKMDVTTPAYRIPAYAGKMGLALNGGKNMLVQSAISESYWVAPSNTTFPIASQKIEKKGLLAANVQTWSDEIKAIDVSGRVVAKEEQDSIMRKEASYTWNGTASLLADGSYPLDDYEKYPFNFAKNTLNPNWEMKSKITLTNVHSKPLEAMDINGDYAATRMDPYHERVTATAAPAKYEDFTFSGFEYGEGNNLKENEVDRGEGSISPNKVHTGSYSLQVASGKTGAKFSITGIKRVNRPFRASLWVYAPGKVEGTANSNKLDKLELIAKDESGRLISKIHPVFQKNKSKSWYLLQLDIPARSSGSQINISFANNSGERDVYIDDFRVHPRDAAMQSYVYDKHTDELIYILDANNLYTKFEYDEHGRLIRTYREVFRVIDKKVSEQVINYGAATRDNLKAGK